MMQEMKKKEKEKAERERMEREAMEAIARKKKHEEEMLLRAVQLIESGKVIARYDKVVFDFHQSQKLLREWAVFTACSNLPDFKLNALNSYMTNWQVNLRNPTLEDVFAFTPEILQLIEELQDFLLLPLETVSVETIYEIGLLYHQFKEKQQEYLDKSTYEIIQDLTKYFDPEQGIFDMTESIPPITFSMYGNIFAQPELISHEFESLLFKFKIPEILVEDRGMFRLLKTEYDHYSDSSSTYFAPGINNALKRSVEDWEKIKRENTAKKATLTDEDVPEIIAPPKTEEPPKPVETENLERKGSQLLTSGDVPLRKFSLFPDLGERKFSTFQDAGDINLRKFSTYPDSEDDLDKQYKKLSLDLENLETISRGGKAKGKKKKKKQSKEGSSVEIAEPAEGEERKTKVGGDKGPRSDKGGEEGKDGVEKDKPGSGSESETDEDKIKSKIRGRSTERREKSKSESGSKSKSTSKTRGRSKTKKGASRSSSPKDKKVKKKSKSQERQKTEAEMAKDRERLEKAQFIPKLLPYELNLRNYTILGGIFHFNWIEIPPQPKERKNWLMHLIEPDQKLDLIQFEPDYIPPTQESQEAKKTPEEMEREAKKQEEEMQKLFDDDHRNLALWKNSTSFRVPRTALWFEPPIPVLWDAEKRIWSKHGFYDIKFNEDQLNLSLRLTKFGIIGFGHNRFANLPYQSFELKPSGRNKCIFSLMAAMTAIEFTFEEDLVCVSSLQNVSNSDVVEAAMLHKYMRPRELIKRLRYHGLDVFPDLDSYAYVDGVLLKHIQTEEHMYQCMAVLAPSYNFHWSRWNLLAGREKMVFQMRERLGTTTPGNYNMILNTPLKCSLIACTEVSPNFSEEPMENSEYHADLLHLAKTIASEEAMDYIEKSSPHFMETVRTMITAVRPVSFS